MTTSPLRRRSATAVTMSEVVASPPREPCEPEQQLVCAVCLSAFDAGEQLTVLPCRHRFHTAEIQRWLADHKTCPLCKADTEEGIRRLLAAKGGAAARGR